MRILLAHNSFYFPSSGGGDKSNRLLMEALAARGHEVRVVARVATFGAESHEALLKELRRRGVQIVSASGHGIHMRLGGVDVRILTRSAELRAYFKDTIAGFDPDVILTSTDDPAQILLDVALRAPRARVVYLLRAIVAAPFGPDSAAPNAAKAALLRHVDGAVGVSEYVADYARSWGGLDAVHVPISLLEPGEYPHLGRFDNPYVSMVNPCAAKGISIFAGLARRFPNLGFAAVPSWGTTESDLVLLRSLPNVSVLPAYDTPDELLRVTRVTLVPSVWAEARSRMILESMARGVPVITSDVGGLREAALGVDYVLPVNRVVDYRPMVDELMVPGAQVPEQDLEPWAQVLQRLVTDRAHYEQLSATARAAALAYAENLTVAKFEAYLEALVRAPRRQRAEAAKKRPVLSPEKKRLLSLRLQQKAKTPEEVN